jgi:hypothetical protein
MTENSQRKTILKNLVDMVVQIGQALARGEEFPQQVPEAIELLKQALVELGNEIIPVLKDKYLETGDLLLLEVIGEMREPQSLDFLIHAYRHSDFMTGMAALIAIRKLRISQGYEHINDLLLSIMNQKDDLVVLSTNEIMMMCTILGEWNDSRAVETLKRAIEINEPPGMPKAAIEGLANYREAHQYLRNLAIEEKSLSKIIHDALNKNSE